MAAAHSAVDGLQNSAEWKNYQAAIVAHESAKNSAEGLTLAEAALERAKGKWNFFTNAATWAAKHSLGLLNIKSVYLLGSFHDLANEKGFLGFNATVTGTLAGQDFKLTRTLDLRNPKGFVISIFEK